MRQYHDSPECRVYACGDDDQMIPEGFRIQDEIVAVFRHGIECGRIICRFDEASNELTYIPSPGLPDWITGYYTGEDYPDSAAGEGYTFAD